VEFIKLLVKIQTSLFLKANMIAPACSAALPTIGSMIMLRKLTDRPHESDASCSSHFSCHQSVIVGKTDARISLFDKKKSFITEKSKSLVKKKKAQKYFIIYTE
jgi:hypothetical protein